MRLLVRTTQFKRDFKKRILNETDLTALEDVLRRLVLGLPFEPRHRDHALKNSPSDVRDCHVKPDLILLYEVAGNEVRLRRLGTHSDLF